jgi:predicted kinase
MRDSRKLVYVSGAPGSGKSSLGVPLAAELGYALLSKDRIKETLHDAFGAPAPDLAWSRRLGGAAMELLWTLAACAPAVVLEANFRPHSQYERANPRQPQRMSKSLPVIYPPVSLAPAGPFPGHR